MANKEEKPEGKESGWKDFIYNPRTGEFLGRTASSWALIFIFYVIFYGFLAGMFSLTMWVMLQTLDDYTPRYRDRVPNPGLMIRPKFLDIEVNRSNSQQYNKYVNDLETFLLNYNDTLQEPNEQCSKGQYYMQDSTEIKQVCPFLRTQLRQCSGLADPSFGYSEGQPCVLIKMNRIIGLMPEGKPYVNCTAKRETPLLMQYFPDGGHIDKMYFPYYGKKAQANYLQPLVAVKLQLSEQDYNTLLTIECKVAGTNLRNNDERDKFLGRITFRIKVTK